MEVANDARQLKEQISQVGIEVHFTGRIVLHLIPSDPSFILKLRRPQNKQNVYSYLAGDGLLEEYDESELALLLDLLPLWSTCG